MKAVNSTMNLPFKSPTIAETTPESTCTTSSSSFKTALRSTGLALFPFGSPPVELPPPFPSSWANTTMAIPTRRIERMKNFILICFWLALSVEIDTLMHSGQMRRAFIPDFECTDWRQFEWARIFQFWLIRAISAKTFSQVFLSCCFYFKRSLFITRFSYGTQFGGRTRLIIIAFYWRTTHRQSSSFTNFV